MRIAMFLTSLFFLPLGSALATQKSCKLTVQEQEKINSQGHELTNRYPSLAFAILDRDAFIAEMRVRFKKQKSLTPDNPHLFDYSEIGLPALRFMRTELAIQRNATIGFRLALKRGIKIKVKNFNPTLHDIEIYAQHVIELIAEIDQQLKNNQVSYYETLKISNYYARAVGYGHMMNHSLLQITQLKFDRYLEGYKPLTPIEEYKLYKENRFFVFQDSLRSGLQGYRQAQVAFVESILNKEELKVVVVPTHEPIDRDVLMWLFSRPDMYISGISTKSIQADGFLRPAGDFWYHDLRHESAKFYERYLYEKENGIPTSQRQRLSQQLEKWERELNAEILKIEDADLRAALTLMSFNFHHDSGYPTAPSLYFQKFNLAKVTAFWFSLVVGGEKTFETPLRNLNKSSKILEDFWGLRRTEEKEFINNLKEFQ